VNNTAVSELMRGIRTQMDSLIGELPQKEAAAMALGLAHRCFFLPSIRHLSVLTG